MASPINGQGATVLEIEGMSCGHCVEAVGRALRGVEGLDVRSVHLGGAQVVAGGAGMIARAIAAVEEAGFSARAVVAGGSGPEGAGPGCSCCGGAGGGR